MNKIGIAIFQGPRVSETGKRSYVYRSFEKWGHEVSIINARDLERGLLDGYAAVYMPGGHSVKLKEKGILNLKRFIRKGGGFLGICNGAHFGMRAKLLNIRDYIIIRGVGTYSMRVVKKHPVTKGLQIVPRSPEKKALDPVPHTEKGRIKTDRENGAFMIVGKNVDALLTFDNEDKLAGAVAGCLGKGRVVLFSNHPHIHREFKSRAVCYNTDVKENELLLRNAIQWVTRVS